MKSNTEYTDQDLNINLLIKGDMIAFEKVVKEYYQMTYRYALYWVKDRDNALDISQEVFVRMFKNKDKIDPDRPLAAWIYVTTRNICRNFWKKKKNIAFSDNTGDSDFDVPDSTPSVLNRILATESQERLWRAINSLPEKEREVILLKDIENLRYADISDLLEIPEGTVMSRLYHARKKLSSYVRGKVQ